MGVDNTPDDDVPSDGEIYARVSEMLDNKRTWSEAIEAAAKMVADTRFFEGDRHMESGAMLALAEKNVRNLKR